MPRKKKPVPIFPDCDIKGVGLEALSGLAGLSRSAAARALQSSYFHTHKVDGFKQPYFTHTDSAEAGGEAWRTHKRTRKPKTDPSSGSSA